MGVWRDFNPTLHADGAGNVERCMTARTGESAHATKFEVIGRFEGAQDDGANNHDPNQDGDGGVTHERGRCLTRTRRATAAESTRGRD